MYRFEIYLYYLHKNKLTPEKYQIYYNNFTPLVECVFIYHFLV